MKSFVAAVLVALTTLPAPAAARPAMEHGGLAYWPERVAKTRQWSQVMYGTSTFRPRLIVEHWTESETQESALDVFNAGPDSPWVHFIIDPQGRITQLAPLDVLAKQALGVSPWAIGIEHVGTTDREVMSNRRQRRASFRLTCWLKERLHIPARRDRPRRGHVQPAVRLHAGGLGLDRVHRLRLPRGLLAADDAPLPRKRL